MLNEVEESQQINFLIVTLPLLCIYCASYRHWIKGRQGTGWNTRTGRSRNARAALDTEGTSGLYKGPWFMTWTSVTGSGSKGNEAHVTAEGQYQGICGVSMQRRKEWEKSPTIGFCKVMVGGKTTPMQATSTCSFVPSAAVGTASSSLSLLPWWFAALWMCCCTAHPSSACTAVLWRIMNLEQPNKEYYIIQTSKVTGGRRQPSGTIWHLSLSTIISDTGL